jgi:hypothetical protein
MKTKRIFGYLLIALSVILTLVLLMNLPRISGVFGQFINLLRGRLDSSQAGETVGYLLYWLVHALLIILSWHYGRRWGRGKQKDHVEK